MASGELWPAQEVQFPYEFPYECISHSAQSTEAESEDDYIAGLAERVAHFMFDDDENGNYTPNEAMELKNGVPVFEQDPWAAENAKVSMAASPRSTLSGLGNWSAPNWRSLSNASSEGSSGVSSQVSSPPSTPLRGQDDMWDLIYSAAEKVVILRMLEEARTSSGCFPVSGFCPVFRGSALGLTQSPPPAWGQSCGVHVPASGHVKSFQARNNEYSTVSPLSNAMAAYVHACNLQHSLNTNAEQEKHMQLIPGLASRWPCQAKPVQQHAAAFFRNGQKSGDVYGGYWMPDSTSSPWPPSQLKGSGMRAVFLGSSRSGLESSGTGVFLPRVAGSRPDTKKPSMSTVLLPSRVVQALKLNIEDIHSHAVHGSPRPTCIMADTENIHSLAVQSIISPNISPAPRDTGYGVLTPFSNPLGVGLQPASAGLTDSERRLMHPNQPASRAGL